MATEAQFRSADKASRAQPSDSPLVLSVLTALKNHGPVEGHEQLDKFCQLAGLDPRTAISHLCRMAVGGYVNFNSLGTVRLSLTKQGNDILAHYA